MPFITPASSAQLGGPDDYAGVETRGDVLVYTSEELTEPLDVLGPVRLVAHVATSAADTDVTAKLVDVHPNGFAQRLCDGLVRLRYRGGHDRVMPGGARRPSTRSRSSCGTRRSASFRATGSGSRSRPRRIPSSRRIWAPAVTRPRRPTACVARNLLHHDPDHPSRLVLTVLGGR